MDTLAALMRGGLQGATFGLGKYPAAAMAKGIGALQGEDIPYQDLLRIVEEQNAAAEQQSPLAYGAGELGGGMAVPIGAAFGTLGKLGGKLVQKSAAREAQQVARTAAEQERLLADFLQNSTRGPIAKTSDPVMKQAVRKNISDLAARNKAMRGEGVSAEEAAYIRKIQKMQRMTPEQAGAEAAKLESYVPIPQFSEELLSQAPRLGQLKNPRANMQVLLDEAERARAMYRQPGVFRDAGPAAREIGTNRMIGSQRAYEGLHEGAMPGDIIAQLRATGQSDRVIEALLKEMEKNPRLLEYFKGGLR